MFVETLLPPAHTTDALCEPLSADRKRIKCAQVLQWCVPPLEQPILLDLAHTRASSPKTERIVATTTKGPKSESKIVGAKRSPGSNTVKENPTMPKPQPRKSTTNSEPRDKTALVIKAHPISIERSQSPACAVATKAVTKNFIAANKRLVSRMDKKPVTPDLSNEDAASDTQDLSIFGPEGFTSNLLLNHIDKLTLASHSKLAEALTKVFVDGDFSDVVVKTKGGKQINAHKCILAARSVHLADCLAADQETTETNGFDRSSIDLQEYSYAVVRFCLLHIYSGIARVPDDLDLDELTRLSHILHMTTLRQVCMHNLRMNYCHYFHKPCNVCCLGVLKTLPLAWRYDYTELYGKCLQWIGSNFASIFCLKEFSELKPQDLIEECYKATLSQLTPETVIPKTIECQKLLKNLPRVKWTEPTICLVGRQLEDFCHYVADNYEKILQSESFLSLAKNCWECEVLEENLLAAMNHLKPESGCKTLIQLHKIECSNESHFDESRNVSDSFANLISKMRKYCERYLLKEANAVVHCSSWKLMNSSLQKRIKDQAVLATDFDEPTKPLATKPKLSSMSRMTTTRSSFSPSNTEVSRSSSNRTTPDAKSKIPGNYSSPPRGAKLAQERQIKPLK